MRFAVLDELEAIAKQARIPAGDERRGRIHPGEFTAPEPEPAPRRHRTADKGKNTRKGTGSGRKTGAVLPPSAKVLNPENKTGQSAAERTALEKEHESRLPDEMVGNFRCANCGWAGWREHAAVTREGKMHATLAFQGCTRCGTMHPAHVGVAGKYGPQFSTRRKEAVRPSRAPGAAVTGSVPANDRASTRLTRSALGKTVDSSETAVQRQDLEGAGPEAVEYVGHRVNCPLGGESPCGADVSGRCGVCDTPVQDHEALTKTAATLLDLRKLAGLA